MFPGREPSLNVISERWRQYVLAMLPSKNEYRRELESKMIKEEKCGFMSSDEKPNHTFSLLSGLNTGKKALLNSLDTGKKDLSGLIDKSSLRVKITTSGTSRGSVSHRERLVVELFKKGISLDTVPVYDEGSDKLSGSLFDVLVSRVSKPKNLQPDKGTKDEHSRDKTRRGKACPDDGPAAKRSLK